MRNSLAVRRLGLSDFIAKGLGSLPDLRTEIPKAMRQSQKYIYMYQIYKRNHEFAILKQKELNNFP